MELTHTLPVPLFALPPVGGGGLISGMSLALKHLQPIMVFMQFALIQSELIGLESSVRMLLPMTCTWRGHPHTAHEAFKDDSSRAPSTPCCTHDAAPDQKR